MLIFWRSAQLVDSFSPSDWSAVSRAWTALSWVCSVRLWALSDVSFEFCGEISATHRMRAMTSAPPAKNRGMRYSRTWFI